jgi:DNA gyrase subunit A
MDRESIITTILAMVQNEGAENRLLEMNVALQCESLYDAATEVFGGWDAALVAALKRSVRGPKKASLVQRAEETVNRQVGKRARDPLYVTTNQGVVFFVDGEEIETTEHPYSISMPEDAGHPTSFQYLGRPDAVFLFSDKGRYFGLDGRLLPQWMGGAAMRHPRSILPLRDGENLAFLLGRSSLRDGRVTHITAKGKGKASSTRDFGRMLEKVGKDAFLLQDQDRPVAVFAGSETDTIFCATAAGQAIHFSSGDMRAMGRKAVGVNVVKLGASTDRVVGAFLSGGSEQVALITASGVAKRMWIDDFRIQGRGGSGMQSVRLAGGDSVAGVCRCAAGEDLVVWTSAGRVHRVPATRFELAGRASRGHPFVELVDGERVLGVAELPCGSV